MTAYQESLRKWASQLSDECIAEYMGALDRFSDEELDALFREDVSRMQHQPT